MSKIVKLEIAFYKAKYGGIDDKFINYFSGKEGYSHCEVVMSATHMIGAHYTGNGVNNFYYNNVYNSKYWDIVSIEVSDDNYKAFCEAMVGTPYDTLGVALSFIGINQIAREHKVWCSEFCALAYNSSDKHILRDTLVMPNELFVTLMYLGGTIVKSTAGSELDKRGDNKQEIDRYGRVSYGKTNKGEEEENSGSTKKIGELLSYFTKEVEKHKSKKEGNNG